MLHLLNRDEFPLQVFPAMIQFDFRPLHLNQKTAEPGVRA
jgi:hypothetical protein